MDANIGQGEKLPLIRESLFAGSQESSILIGPLLVLGRVCYLTTLTDIYTVIFIKVVLEHSRKVDCKPIRLAGNTNKSLFQD